MTEVAGALAAYVIPAALITILPGPDTAMVLATATKAGRAPAVRAAFGVGVGILVWGAAAAVGLASALRSSTVVYDGFRLVCAAYLIFLAVRVLLGTRQAHQHHGTAPAADRVGQEPEQGSGRAGAAGWGFRRALLTCLLNPKLGVFFVVVLPQFIPAGYAVAPMSMALSTLHAVEVVAWYLVLGRVAVSARRLLARPAVQRWLDRATAAVFVVFGIRLGAETVT